MSPNDSRTLWYGGQHAWRTRDGAASWQQASTAFGARTSALAVATGDGDRVVYGLEDGTLHATADGLTAGATTPWSSAHPRDGFVSWTAFDPQDPLRVYATYATFGGHHLWTSGDGGVSWQAVGTDGSRRFPNLPAHSVIVDPARSERIFVGTDLGVYVSTDGGATWATERSGFANTVVESMEIATFGNGRRVLFAFTHGRGAWRVEMSDP